MEHAEFLTNMEVYYERYDGYEKKFLTEYLWKNFQEKDLDFLQILVFKCHSKTWEVNPDIAVFEEMRKKYFDYLNAKKN